MAVAQLPPTKTRCVGEIDAASFRQAVGRFLSGVTVVMATDPESGEPHGMTASAFLSVSLDPPLILVSLDRRSRMLEIIDRVERFSISILDQGQEELARCFAGQTAVRRPPLGERSGVPMLAASLAYVVARKVELRAAGDHDLCIAQIEELGYEQDGAPLAYFGGRFYRIAPAESDVVLAWPTATDPLWM